MRNDIILLGGVERPEAVPWAPFAPEAIDFLEAVSEAVRACGDRREELAAFAFWCRRSHLESLKIRHACPQPRLGRGLIFHVAPSNVPAMFAYTYAIGLLAGNANIVRLSTRRGEMEARLCGILKETLDRPCFEAVKARSAFVSYERDDEITGAYLAGCDGRVIWGGDEAVSAIRRLPMPPHAVELCFPDRWSFALLSQAYLSAQKEEELEELACRFYNDTYFMDQNACSSPQMVIWLKDGGEETIRRRWWEAVAKRAGERYSLGPYRAARKYERFCREAMTMTAPSVARLEKFGGNLVYVAGLDALPVAPIELKGGFGLFYESETENLEALLPMLSAKVQTLCCAGLEPGKVAAFLAEHRAKGVDRVVPIGRALEMDTVWDGHDLIGALSRMIG